MGAIFVCDVLISNPSKLGGPLNYKLVDQWYLFLKSIPSMAQIPNNDPILTNGYGLEGWNILSFLPRFELLGMRCLKIFSLLRRAMQQNLTSLKRGRAGNVESILIC